jgi:hypothetical protein
MVSLMPYIKEEDRDKVYYDSNPTNAGELNYLFTMIAINYFEGQGGRYQQINDILGALEGCKLELYRRLAAPYEDKKIIENGDVYDTDA